MSTEKKTQPGFEADLEKLEAIVRQLEGGNLPLEEALKQFEAGIALTRKCEKTLKAAERKIEKLVQTMDGGFETEDFEEAPEESELPAPAQAPAPRRTAPPAAPVVPEPEENFWSEEEPDDTTGDLF
ncbi:MAG: Exodeoxyribonuclease 7 small subunit [Candidatus Hydrogenedentes bacterium ADurb.Bin170]|jgi:exodeoxyribonuclease VII small subunit|nr:MAG: Exodeoxyribonuclease 7 small subunit [Candidatus Hydrogenedentes bacterium ADurb.Bin170]